MLMLPTFQADPRVRLVAASDPRPEAGAQFEREFGGRCHATVEAMCADPDVDALYIATPNELHAEHVVAAARHGKHALVEKPMAIAVDEGLRMVAAVRAAGVVLVVGHSHSFDAPYLRARDAIARGTYGRARMITALNYTDWLYRPRRQEELDTAKGGGVVFSQGAHQVDIVRLLAGSPARSVRARTGAWIAERPADGAYAAQLTFEDGAFASLVYSGYAHFDSDELAGWVGEMGVAKEASAYGAARSMLGRGMSADAELALKNRRGFGATAAKRQPPIAHNHFGMVVVSCDRADLRPMPNGVMVYDDTGTWLDEIPPPTVPRAEVIDELCDAVTGRRAALHSGGWGLATLEVCLGIVESSRTGKEVRLRHQPSY